MADIFELFGGAKARTEFQSMVFIESGNTHVREKKDVLTLDATIETNHNFVARTSEHPIEGGENVVDHVDLRPASITVRGVMSKEPLTIVSALIGNFAGASSIATEGRGLGLGIAGNVAQSQLGGYLQESIYGDRAKDSLETLLTMYAEKRLIDVVTKLRVYQDMIIESISIPSNITHGDAIEFTANMRAVQIVESETATISEKISATNTPTPADKADKGRQAAKNVSDQKIDDIKKGATTTLYKAADLSLKLLGYTGLE